MTQTTNSSTGSGAYCGVVTYNPSPDSIAATIQSILRNTDKLIVVDNSDSGTDLCLPDSAVLLRQGRNLGIAAAQNRGILHAMAYGAEYVWLSDQDTCYPDDFLVSMLTFLGKCRQAGSAVGSVAPVYFDVLKNERVKFIRQTPFTQKFDAHPGANAISHSIASGAVIPVSVLKQAGMMQESLFIDWVDLEWCWRVKNQFGYQNIGNGDVVISHALGDGYEMLFGRRVSIRSPLRHYYMIRNAVHLSLYSQSATLPIRLEIFIKALAWTWIFPALVPAQRLRHLRATLTGLRDGLRNRMGKKPD